MPAPSGQNRKQSSGLADVIAGLVEKHMDKVDAFHQARRRNPD